MQRARRWLLPVLGAALALAAATARAEAPPKVVVSIKPVHSIIAGLMEDVAEPTLLIDGQTTPYQYEPDGADKEALAEADLVLWVGPELEGSLAEAIDNLPEDGPRVIELLSHPELKVLPLRDGGSDTRDPFFWLDTRNMLILLDEMARLLVEMDPERTDTYARNRTAVMEQTSRVDRQLEYQYRDVSASPIGLYYDALQYFEQAYAAAVAARVVPQPGEEAGAAGLLTARQKMQEAGAECFFTVAGLPSPYLSTLTQGTDFKVAELDLFGLEIDPGPGLYAQLMREDFKTIRDCVKPEKAGHSIMEAGDNPAGGLNSRFVLVNHQGETVTNQDFLGEFQLVYFGYTHCPDICPTSLAVLTGALNQLGPLAKELRPIFVTLDPERDTVPVMKDYVEYFHPRLVGLTGPEKMIKQVADNFRVRYEKVPAEGAGGYFMDHSAGLYLLDPQGQFVTKFAHGISPDQLAKELRPYLERGGS